MNDRENLPECCKRKSGIESGLLAGIIPHVGCIAILLFTILGVTVANSFFRKFLFSPYYLYIVFALSFSIAIVTALFYVRRFEDRRVRSHWKYLVVLFSSVIVINLLMIYLIFPYAANLSGKVVEAGSEEGKTEILKLSFEIPCSGHAPLVISELEKVSGINSAKFISGKTFEIYYNPKTITKTQILSQDICKEFDAKEE